MERIMKNCVPCAGDGVYVTRAGDAGAQGISSRCRGRMQSPARKGSGRCRVCRGSGQVVDWSRSFEPDIFVRTSEQIPRSISCAAITGAGWRHLPVPDEIQEQPHEAQQRWVSERVREHYQESGGESPLFGAIVGYAWRHARDQSIRFDTQGRILDKAV